MAADLQTWSFVHQLNFVLGCTFVLISRHIANTQTVGCHYGKTADEHH
jgi:hypothetical protein